MNFSIQMDGDEHAAKRLERLGSHATKARPVLNTLVDQILEIQSDRFARNQGMKAEKPSTKLKDRQQGRDPRPLRSTGALERSVTQRGAPHQVLYIDNSQLRVGTNLKYARYHQYGVGVTKRKVLNLTPKQRQKLSQTVLDYIVRDK